MPFTPLHIGPALFIGLIFSLDMFTLLVASVILDVEAFYSMFIVPAGYLHGFFHSYLGASIVGSLLAIFISKIQKSYFRKTLFSSLIGVYSHVFLDSFLYSDIKPFYPFEFNSFYKMISSQSIYFICVAAFLLSFVLFINVRKIW